MSKSTQLSYEGKDLETMSGASNYYAWMLSYFAPYLGKNFVEIGAGSGTFSKVLAGLKPHSLTVLEPSPEMFPLLQKTAQKIRTAKSVYAMNDFLSDAVSKIKKQKPDSVFYINVLEHVPDDNAELKIVADMLDSGGHVFIFVPAIGGLMSNFDRKIGHYRRYTKTELEQKLHKAGFEIITSRYMDMFGVLPWWLKYTMMGSTTMEPGLVSAYDRFFVPTIRLLEGALQPPIGKNVLVVARKK